MSLVLIFIFLFLTPILVVKSIKITSVTCVTQYGQCGDSLLGELGLVKGRDLKSSKNYIENILKNDMAINDYLVQYKIPSTLDVEINLKKPKFSIFDLNSNKYYILDKNGLIIDLVDDSSLPVVKVDNLNMEVGQQLNNQNKFALDILNYLTYLYSIDEGIIENESFKVKNTEGVDIIFPLEGDLEFLIGGLRLIFSRLNDESEGIRMNDIREIDLRYSNPVLRQYE